MKHTDCRMVELDPGIFFKHDMSEMVYIEDRGYYFPAQCFISDSKVENEYEKRLNALKSLFTDEGFLECSFGPDWKNIWTDWRIRSDPELLNPHNRFIVMKWAPEKIESLGIGPFSELYSEEERNNELELYKADEWRRHDEFCRYKIQQLFPEEWEEGLKDF